MSFEADPADSSYADSSALLHADHSPRCGIPALVDAALERSASILPNALSVSIWELRSGEWSAFKSELHPAGPSAAGLSTGLSPYV